MTSWKFPVEAGHVLAFTRALTAADAPTARTGEPGLPAQGDPVPATFAVASNQFNPDYHLRPEPGQPWHGSGAGAGLAKEGAGGLHAEQHYVYHRPIRVGDLLSATTRAGDEWEKQGRSGRLKFAEQVTEFRDESGDLVVTARSVSVRREES